MGILSTLQFSLYPGHSIREAGLGLAMLYMTVLGFDTITWGYCRQQGVTESVLGLLTGVSALVGVAGARYYYWVTIIWHKTTYIIGR